MKQQPLHSVYETILTLRRQIEEAYAQGNLPAALVLSCQMDSMQLECWQALTAQGS